MTRASIRSYNKPQSRGRSRSRGRGWYERQVYVPDAGKRVAPIHREVALKGHHSRLGPAPTNSRYSRQLMSRGRIDLSRHKSPTMLMTKEMERKIPSLYSTEDKKPEDVRVYAHYFTPFSNWDWYITEYDGKDTMFGLVKGHEVELGYISLSELKSQGANVERDLYFGEKSLAEVMRDTNYPLYKESEDEKPDIKRQLNFSTWEQQGKWYYDIRKDDPLRGEVLVSGKNFKTEKEAREAMDRNTEKAVKKYYSSKKKQQFVGPCDRIRQTSEGETWFHKTMSDKKEISEKEFIKNIDPKAILDEGETWAEYRTNMERQDTVKYYKSDDVYFFQTVGFEYFWRR